MLTTNRTRLEHWLKVRNQNRMRAGVIMSLHPGVPLCNAFIGATGYIVYRVMASRLESVLEFNLSLLQELKLHAIIGYTPVISEIVGLLLGFCLCMLEVQSLKHIDRTPNLRVGLLVALCGDCDEKNKILAYRKLKRFRRCNLLVSLIIVVSALTIISVTKIGVLITSSLALVPIALATIFRKRLLARIESEVVARYNECITSIQYQKRLVARKILAGYLCVSVAICGLLIYLALGQ